MSEKGKEGYLLTIKKVRVYKRCQTAAQFLPGFGLSWVESQMLGVSVGCIQRDSLLHLTKCCGKTNEPGGQAVLRDHVGIAPMP